MRSFFAVAAHHGWDLFWLLCNFERASFRLAFRTLAFRRIMIYDVERRGVLDFGITKSERKSECGMHEQSARYTQRIFFVVSGLNEALIGTYSRERDPHSCSVDRGIPLQRRRLSASTKTLDLILNKQHTTRTIHATLFPFRCWSKNICAIFWTCTNQK